MRVPAVEEETEGDPRELVERNAARKAEAVAAGARAALIIAGDTEVVVDGRVLGQPGSEPEAREHLEILSGREHQVFGGVALLAPGSEGVGLRTGVEVSTVGFRQLGSALITAYLDSGEWRGRAGSYAIQGLGAALVERVEGDVSNVIGLPVPLLLELAPELAVPG